MISTGAGGAGKNRSGLIGMKIRKSLFCCLVTAVFIGPRLFDRADAAPHKQAVEFAVKPYLLRVTRDSVKLAWIQTAPGEAKVGYRRRGSEKPEIRQVVTGSSVRREVVLAGLEPAAFYEYEVVLDGGVAFSGVFRTGVAPGEPFSFIVWGGTRAGETSAHGDVVDAMRLERPDLLVHTGDLVARAAKSHYFDFFESVAPLASRVPIHPCLGKRDLAGDADKGLELFRSFFPGTGETRRVFYSLVYGNSKFIFLDTSSRVTRSQDSPDMYEWAEKEIKNAEKEDSVRHVFVVFNHGPYGSGPAGSNEMLQKAGLLEIFRKSGVVGVFSGKDRLYERGSVEGLNYVVSAGGGSVLDRVTKKSMHTQMAESAFHYVRVLVSGDRVEFTTRRIDGAIIDAFEYEKKIDTESTRYIADRVLDDDRKSGEAMGKRMDEESQEDGKMDRVSPEESRADGKAGEGGMTVWTIIAALISVLFLFLGCLVFYYRFRKK